MLYVKIHLYEHGNYIQPLDLFHCFIDEVKGAAANGEKSIWVVRLVEMTEEEYAQLPEFEGY